MTRLVERFELDEEERFQTRIAWHYFVGGLTQGAIAELLGTTRLRVNRALATSRQNGIVQVRINSRYGPCVELENRLTVAFPLKDAIVVPATEQPENIRLAIGAALASYIAELCDRDLVRSMGIGWGQTLREAVWALEKKSRPDLEIVSMMGGLTRGSMINAIEIASRLAERLGAGCTYLTAPLYASSEQSRDTIMMQDVFREVFPRMRTVDAAFFSAGDMTERSLLIRDALPKDVNVADLVRLGAVGDIAGHVLDAEGRLIDHPVNRRVIGTALHEIKALDRNVLAAGGAHKVPIIKACLKAAIVNVVVTDEGTAEAVLEGIQQPEKPTEASEEAPPSAGRRTGRLDSRAL